MIGQRDFDVIAVGSGHNGLVAAAYLAKAGKRVLMLERNAWFPGGVDLAGAHAATGFRHDQHSMTHIFIQANPLLQRDELGLKSRYGLRYLFPESPMMSVFEDGSTLALHRDRPLHPRPRSASSQNATRKPSCGCPPRRRRELPMLVSTLYTPPMPQGAGFAFLDQSREGQQFWRAMQMSSHDAKRTISSTIACARISHALPVRTWCHRMRRRPAWVCSCSWGSFEAYGFGVPVGGSGKLTEALTRSIEDRGGIVLANQDVREVVVANGRAAGVITADGTRYSAREAVIERHPSAQVVLRCRSS